MRAPYMLSRGWLGVAAAVCVLVVSGHLGAAAAAAGDDDVDDMSHFDVLGITRDATQAEIKKACECLRCTQWIYPPPSPSPPRVEPAAIQMAASVSTSVTQ